MSTHHQKSIVGAIAIFTIAVGHIGTAVAGEEQNGALVEHNRAYIYPIPGAPNPAPDRAVQNAQIVYVNMAYGPAIYSYPANTTPTSVPFNVEYVDTAYGPAIYSYPRHALKHHLTIVSQTDAPEAPIVATASD